MALSNEAKQAAKEAVAKAGKAARERATKLVTSAKASAGKANTKLREMKGRRIVDAVEVVVGANVAAAVHGMDYSIKYGANYADDGKTLLNPSEVTEVPYGLVGGVALVGAGIVTKSYDLQSTGLGMVAYGTGRMVEDAVRDASQKS